MLESVPVERVALRPKCISALHTVVWPIQSQQSWHGGSGRVTHITTTIPSLNGPSIS